MIAGSRDEDAWSRCEGRLWLDLDSARARTDATDRSAEAGGVFFDLGLGQCSEEFAKIRSDSAASANAETKRVDLGRRDQPHGMRFSRGVSTLHIACQLLWLFGPFSVARRDGRSSTVELPAGVPVELLGHVVVRIGEKATRVRRQSSLLGRGSSKSRLGESSSCSELLSSMRSGRRQWRSSER